MSTLRSLTATRRWLLLALFACAMLLRAAVPGGWMPLVQPEGVALVPCDGMGPMTHHGMDHAAMAPDAAAMPVAPGKAPSDRHDPRPDHPCTFAGLGLAAAVPVPIVPPVAMPVPAPVAAFTALAVAIGHGLAAPPPPPTGPPPFA